MPTFRPEKFTVTQRDGLAQNRMFFLKENEPISRHLRPVFKPSFCKNTKQTQFPITNSKDGSKPWIGSAYDHAPPVAMPSLRSPNPLQKMTKRSQFQRFAAATCRSTGRSGLAPDIHTFAQSNRVSSRSPVRQLLCETAADWYILPA